MADKGCIWSFGWGCVTVIIVIGIFAIIGLLKDDKKREELTKQPLTSPEELTKQQLTLQENWNALFNKMTPEQHLSAIKQGEEAIYERKHLEALAPGSPERKEAEKFLRQKAKEQEAKDKAKMELLAIARKSFAKELETLFLDKMSMDTKVTVEGKNNTTLRIRGVLMGRVMAYQLFNKAGLGETGGKLGFEKVIFESSIDHSSWVYTLNK